MITLLLLTLAQVPGKTDKTPPRPVFTNTKAVATIDHKEDWERLSIPAIWGEIDQVTAAQQRAIDQRLRQGGVVASMPDVPFGAIDLRLYHAQGESSVTGFLSARGHGQSLGLLEIGKATDLHLKIDNKEVVLPLVKIPNDDDPGHSREFRFQTDIDVIEAIVKAKTMLIEIGPQRIKLAVQPTKTLRQYAVQVRASAALPRVPRTPDPAPVAPPTTLPDNVDDLEALRDQLFIEWSKANERMAAAKGDIQAAAKAQREGMECAARIAEIRRKIKKLTK